MAAYLVILSVLYLTREAIQEQLHRSQSPQTPSSSASLIVRASTVDPSQHTLRTCTFTSPSSLGCLSSLPVLPADSETNTNNPRARIPALGCAAHLCYHYRLPRLANIELQATEPQATEPQERLCDWSHYSSPVAFMDWSYSPHREAGGTLHVPSPTHSPHYDAVALQKLRRSLSRSPSKPTRIHLNTRSPAGSPNSPLSPLDVVRAVSPVLA